MAAREAEAQNQLMGAGRDYRRILNEQFAARKRKNPHYSLRAFARDLCISAPRLSRLLSGQIGLSPEAADLIARRLMLPDESAQLFRDSAEAIHARGVTQREAAKARLERLRHGPGAGLDRVSSILLTGVPEEKLSEAKAMIQRFEQEFLASFGGTDLEIPPEKAGNV